MTHQSFEQDLQAWIDGELPAARRKELSAHLSACPDCRRREYLLRSVLAAVPPPEPVSVGFTDRLLARIEREGPQKGARQAPFLSWLLPPRRPLARAVAFASCAAILLAGGLFLAKRAQRPMEDGSRRAGAPLDRCLSASCGAS